MVHFGRNYPGSHSAQLNRHSYISFLTISKNKITLRNHFFEFHDCVSHSITGRYEGTFSEKNSNRRENVIEHIPAFSRFTLHLPQVVSHWNNTSNPDGCELSNWEMNVTQEVSGKYCRPFQVPKISEKVLDLVFVENDELRFGRAPSLVGGPNFNEMPLNLSEIIYYKTHSF